MYVRCSCYGGTLDFNTRYLLLPFLSVLVGGFLSLFFCLFRFCVVSIFILSLELCRCSSGIFLSSKPRTGLATTYITGY